MSSPSTVNYEVHSKDKTEKVVEPTSLSAIDEHVGSKIRERRVALGLTQQQMAKMIGVTYQQAHKYERGINRISAGRLYSIAKALNVQISFFYEGLDATDNREVTVRQRKCLEMARNFSQINNESQQNALSQLARTLAQN